MAFVYQGDSDLESRSKKAAERISENMHIVANEPSLALYRLQEHVRKALPTMTERRVEVTKLQQELQGRCYDVEYGLSAVKSMENASASFKNIQDMLKQSIFLKQQLKYEESRRNKKDSSSVYKRLSAHIVLDLPDLSEFSMALRRYSKSCQDHVLVLAKLLDTQIWPGNWKKMPWIKRYQDTRDINPLKSGYQSRAY